MPKYRKKPVEIEAVQFVGDNWDEMREFTPGFRVIKTPRRSDDERGVFAAEVFDKLHDAWIPVVTDDYVIRGVVGEFYPCAPGVFRATYEAVESR